MKTTMKLSEQLPGIVIGGGVFNTQMNSDPLALPVAEIIAKSFELGINAIDTSPYYGPSEELIGNALKSDVISSKYKRSDYILMTKAGRIALNEFNYSGEWFRKSVARSCERFGTDYIDLVYAHDIEFVTDEELLEAVGELFNLQQQGIIRFVGISAYHPKVISAALPKIKAQFGKVPDVIQNYAHFTLQNTSLADEIDEWKRLGVDCITNSSPLNMGLLSGRPAAAFHPAPVGLRTAAMAVADHCKNEDISLPDLALRYTFGKWNELADRNGGGVVINGLSFVSELDSVVSVYKEFMVGPEGGKPVGNRYTFDKAKLAKYEPQFTAARKVFGDWLDVEWVSPPPDFVRVNVPDM